MQIIMNSLYALDKMSKSGALFDIVKLNDVSKNVICKMKADRCL